MKQTVFEIDGANFEDFPGFVREFNRGFIIHVGGDWHGNLDAFDDYLSWNEAPCTIRWRNSEKSRRDLGNAAMANWLADNLTRCHPTNSPSVQQRLEAANNSEGPTLFDWLVEIIHENSEWVELVLD